MTRTEAGDGQGDTSAGPNWVGVNIPSGPRVFATGSVAQAYAEGILNVCKFMWNRRWHVLRV